MMRTADADILILAAPGPDHWASRWAARLPTARRLEAGEDAAASVDALRDAVRAASRPVVIVAHDEGVLAVAAAGAALAGRVAGAFLVAAPAAPAGAVAARPLPFPALLVASRDDPRASYEASEVLARALGAELVDAGNSGHLDEASGHGPWPEGLMRLAGFLKHLAPPPSPPHRTAATEMTP